MSVLLHAINKTTINVNYTLLPCAVESKPTPGDVHGSYSPSRSISSI